MVAAPRQGPVGLQPGNPRQRLGQSVAVGAADPVIVAPVGGQLVRLSRSPSTTARTMAGDVVKSSVSASSARAFIGKLYPRAPIAGNRTARPSAKRELMTGLSMMTWLMRYAFFDLTTTGLPRSHQRPYPR